MSGCDSTRKDIETKWRARSTLARASLRSANMLLKEAAMTRKEATEYQARITNDAGIVRGKIPSPLVREMGSRPGDIMIFRTDDSGTVTMSLSRGKGTAKKAAKGAKGAKKTGAAGK